MLQLYMRPSCPYCKKVREAMERLGIEAQMKDIGEGENAKELLERGGKQQVPYLVDTERSTEMYESDDIVTYLEDTYGQPAGLQK